MWLHVIFSLWIAGALRGIWVVDPPSWCFLPSKKKARWLKLFCVNGQWARHSLHAFILKVWGSGSWETHAQHTLQWNLSITDTLGTTYMKSSKVKRHKFQARIRANSQGGSMLPPENCEVLSDRECFWGLLNGTSLICTACSWWSSCLVSFQKNDFTLVSS